jgi:predicted amidohydrolase YtcJ
VIEEILGIVDGAVKAWNAWRADKKETAIEDRGRQLQNVDRLSETVKEAIDARRSDARIDALTDAALDAELRRPPPAGRAP